MPRKKPPVFERSVDVGPCRITITATGNPLAWDANDRARYEHCVGLVNQLERIANEPVAAGPATTSQP